MDERIKKLAEQAGFDLYEDGSFRVEPGQWINAELEKFAELIVQECVNCYSPDDSADDWADKMRRMIEP
jgi:hypothetical protein